MVFDNGYSQKNWMVYSVLSDFFFIKILAVCLVAGLIGFLGGSNKDA